MTLDLQAPPVRGASSDDREAWHEQRRQGVTATEVRDLRKGSSAERRRILTEKLTGERSFTGNRYTEHGNLREPIIADWIALNFGIEPNAHVYSRGRYLATPDGWDGEDIAEIKTSKHNLDPDGSHFGTTGYYDQIQWQLLVMGARRCLFVWEQHDDDWPDPKPLYEQPLWMWIHRDEARIAELIDVADRFLLELDAQRADGLAPVGDLPPTEADLVHQLLAARTQEAVAKAQKERAWKQLQELYLQRADDQWRNPEAVVTVSTVRSERKVLSEQLLQAADAEQLSALQAAETQLELLELQLAAARTDFERAREPFLAVQVEETKKLTITAAKSKKGTDE